MTGGTGITSRDSTYEAVSGLLDKRLDGFGELFRMLSYEQIGSAAMMSRACAGLVAGTHRGVAAGIGERRAPGDGTAAHSRARPPGPRGITVRQLHWRFGDFDGS